MTEEWTTIKKTRKSKSASGGKQSTGVSQKLKHAVAKGTNLNMQMEATEFTVSEFSLIMSDMKATAFVCDLFDRLSSVGLVESIIGLGIGSFTSSASSRLQLALLCLLSEELLRRRGEASRCKVFIFDPVMSAEDRAICDTLGIDVLSDNLKGKHCNNGTSTLYFMPHCPYRLYCNLLWSNWDHLHSTVILGNSFSSYSLRRISSDNGGASDLTDTVMRLLPFLKEVEVWRSSYAKDVRSNARLSSLENAFCDLSLLSLLTDMNAKQSAEFASVLSCRASEESIDQSSENDEELF